MKSESIILAVCAVIAMIIIFSLEQCAIKDVCFREVKSLECLK